MFSDYLRHLVTISLFLSAFLFLGNANNIHGSNNNGVRYECLIDSDGKTTFADTQLNNTIKLEEQSDGVSPITPLSQSSQTTLFCNLKISCNNLMANIWIFQPQRDIQFIKDDAYEYELRLPSDTYEFFTYIRKSKHHFILIYKKDIHVFSDTTIHVSVNEGNVFTEFKFFREDNSPLRLNTFGFYYLLEPKSLLGAAFNHLNLDSTSFILQYNDLPDYFHNSWLVKGKQDWNRDNIYLINNHLAESAKDTLISNDPRNYAYADITYHFPDSIYHNGSMIQVATLAPAYHYFPNDRLYTVPFEFRIYQDTSGDFSLYQSRFSQSVNATKAWGTEVKTSEIKIGTDKIYSYLSPEEYDEPVILSESRSLNLGVSPTYWAGRFMNSEDSIKVGLVFGFKKIQQLFLSMTNDVINQPFSVLSLHSEDQTIDFTNLINPLDKDELAFYGYRESDLRFVSAGSQPYMMRIMNLHSEVARQPGKSIAYASFNLSRIDKNPPFMRSFQILTDQKITNILENGNVNTIRIIAKDDKMLSEVKMSYSKYDDSLWVDLLLEYIPPYYKCTLPELETGYYSLKIYLADSSQNWIENVMEPAFHMGEVTYIEQIDPTIRTNGFFLSEGFPNPFNSSTSIKYSIPVGFSSHLDISIYDLVGRKVYSLVSGRQKPGIYNTNWQAIDNRGNPVATGMYFVRMKGGENQILRKVLLIR